MKRILTVWKVLVAQLDILETMAPLEFLAFRGRIETASGFQSFQFREIELAHGLKDRKVGERFPAGTAARLRLEERLRGPTLTLLCEQLTDLDEGLQEWRCRHVKMVERTIGAKTGTGGSAGAENLRRTLFRPVFPSLWAIRSEL